MQSLYRFLESLRDYLITSLLCVISLALIASSDAPQTQVLRGIAVGVFATLQTPTAWVVSFFRSREETSTLRTINMELLEEVMQLRCLRRENENLREMLGFRQRSLHPIIAAEIIGTPTLPGQKFYTLDAGTDRGIQVGLPVIHENGLVGKVFAASRGHSIVQSLLSKTFRVAAKIRRSRVDGIVSWESGPHLILRNVLKTADVAVGDTIVTSTFSNIFPSEIPIGSVLSIGPDETGNFNRIVVRPFVDFSRLEHVYVMQWSRHADADSLEMRLGVSRGPS
ncbi:MAG: rod shape-determining protein MreC [Bacteroidota bacterium]|nr:rod shape-determining protein MreC [Bacteroidota bacterium]